MEISKLPGLIFSKFNKYRCPFCGSSSRHLLPIGLDEPILYKKKVIGGGKRPGGCPECGSTDRERLVYVYLKEVAFIFSPNKIQSILHIAPEKKISEKIFKLGFSEYVCGDKFSNGYKYEDYVKNIDILDIPYSDNYFDLIICNHVLEHIPNDSTAMKELLRVLKPGGVAILQVPISKNSEETFEDFSVTDPKEREKVFGQFDHVRIYGRDYVQRLKNAGFRVKIINISKRFREYGLNPAEDLFLGMK